MSTHNAIVFGATGQVGSVAARAAQQHGSKVFLALRDTSKAVPGLTPLQEKEGGFARVQADLAKPASLHDAVSRSGARRAFIYPAHGTPDGMRSSVEALKSAGIEFVVFLSSSSVQDEPSPALRENLVARQHATAEGHLREVFGPGAYLAVRPGWFASNTGLWGGMVREGNVKVAYPEAAWDYISPGDIGRVCGRLLALGPGGAPDKAAIYVYGPSVLYQREAIDVVAKVLGQDLKTTVLSEDEGLAFFVGTAGWPEPMARSLLGTMKDAEEEGKWGGLYQGPLYEEGVANIEKYGGKAATTFEAWVEEHKEIFGS